jgi:hypothetical protein
MAVTGVNRDAQCIVHHDRRATVRCITCHKPLCSECVVSTTDGSFCSHECAKKAEDFRGRFEKAKVGGSGIGKLFRAVVWVVVIIAALGIVNRFVWKIPALQPFLDKLPVIGAANQSPASQQPAGKQAPMQL